jgi:hypothetical protein
MTRAVGVELLAVDAVLREVVAGGGVGLDRAVARATHGADRRLNDLIHAVTSNKTTAQ